ncbi:hypothetical protein DICVIV_09660 [Dictyocaulus viviparus]|uniref:G-protein coupled receptors family 1 profile domain-containing protein n=1 Tax=Dictyocaulus viviparus TaxID=29172 RepID=A0A0D8XIA6_DICVI|nr:hypothetical protein DICVIV_09660 [Dictyocaulus viviparus]
MWLDGRRLHEQLNCPPFWYGFTYISLSTSFLLLNVLVAVLISHTFSGISLVFEWDMPDLLSVFLGSILSATWISTTIYDILLAVHRMLSVVFPTYEVKYFQGKCKTIILLFAHSTIPLFTAMKWTNWTSYKFNRIDFLWCYDRTLLMGNVFYLIDSYAMVPFILCSFVCYSMIFYTIKTKDIKKRSNAVTFNVFIYSVLCTFNFILWQFLEPLFTSKPFVYLWTNLPWILWNGTYAIICICFNRSIRENALQIVRCRRPAPKQILMMFIKKPQMTMLKTSQRF